MSNKCFDCAKWPVIFRARALVAPHAEMNRECSGTGRVLLVRGGSIPAGKGVKTSYVCLLERPLAAAGFRCVNISRAGETSFEGVATFDEDIVPFRPDIVIVHFGIDDIYRPVYRSEFKENLVHISRRIRVQLNSEVLLLTSHPFENSFEMDTALVYYRTIREVALDLGCHYVPVHLWWISSLVGSGKPHSDAVQHDWRWPNEHGHAIIADTVMNKIRQIISRAGDSG